MVESEDEEKSVSLEGVKYKSWRCQGTVLKRSGVEGHRALWVAMCR